MDIMFYGQWTSCEPIKKYLEAYHVSIFENLETFIQGLFEKHPDFVFVTMDNAAGMEGVIAAKKMYAELPVVWISNDRDFAAQAYRLNAACFAVKPLSEEKIYRILKHCDLI